MKKILILILTFSLINANAQTETDVMTQTKKWSVSFMPSAGIAYLKSNKTTQNIDSMGIHRQGILSYGFALSANYKIKNRITLNAGVQYLVNGYYKFIDPLALFSPGQNTGNELNHYTRINHLNLPISADFSVSKNNKLKYGLGVFVGLNLNTKTKVEYTDNTPTLNATNLEKFNSDFGILNSLSYSFKISTYLEMPLKATYNLGIKNISNTSEKLRTSNLQLGLGLKLIL